MIIKDIVSFFSFLKPSNIKGWFNIENVFINYFWFYTICATLLLVINQGVFFNIGFPFIIYSLLLIKGRWKPLNIIDIIVIISFVWISVTWIFNSYPHQNYIIMKCFLAEIAYMATYWIARCNHRNYLQEILNNARKPLVITCVIGIYCFVFEPSWYMNIVENAVSANRVGTFAKEAVIDQYRLRSIFDGAYPLAYFCSIMIVYEFFIFFSTKRRNLPYYRYHLLFLLLIIFSAILCMMRAPLFSAFIGMFIAYFYSMLYKNANTTIKMMSIFLLISIAGLYLFSKLDLSTLDVLYSKVEDFSDNDSFVSDRLFLQAQSFNVFGEGYGKYGEVAAYKFSMVGIPDGEYVKIVAEQGFIGLFLTILLFGVGLLKAIFCFKHLSFECFMIIMLLICMVGADPLTISNKHCILFWLALGQISNYNVKKIKFYDKNKSNSNVSSPISSDSRE